MADKLNSVGLQYLINRFKVLFAKQNDLDALDAKVDEIISEGGEPNTIEQVKVNGTALVPDAQKAVDVSVPQATSELDNDGDGDSPFATKAYVDQNGGKIDSISVNGTAQTIDQDKNVDLDVPEVFVGSLADKPTASISMDTKYLRVAEDTVQNGEYGVLNVIAGDGNTSIIKARRVPYWASMVSYVSSVLPTNVSDLTNDSDYQTETEVQALIGAALADITEIDFQVVTELPATGEKGVIYLVPKTGSVDDIYNEYIWVAPTTGTAHFEPIGTTSVDLSGYWSKAELVDITTAEIDAMFE